MGNEHKLNTRTTHIHLLETRNNLFLYLHIYVRSFAEKFASIPV